MTRIGWTGFIPVALLLALLGPLIAFVPRQLPAWSILLALLCLVGGSLAQKRFAMPDISAFWMPVFLAVGPLFLFACLSMLWSPARPLWFVVVNIAYLTAVGTINWRVLAGSFGKIGEQWLLRIAIASLTLGMLLFAIDVAADFPILRFVAGKSAQGQLYMSNVPKRTATVFALMLWPLLFALVQRTRRCYLWSGVMGLALAVAWLSTSRSACLALAIGSCVFMLGRWRPRLARGVVRSAFVLLLLLAPLAAEATVFLPQSLTSHMFPSAQQRILIWQFAAREIKARPLIGHGIDSSHALEAEAPSSPFNPGHPVMSEHPHDAALQIWLELGLIGVLCSLWAGLRFLALIDTLPQTASPFAWAAIATALSLHSMTYGVWQAWWIAGQTMTAVVFALAVRHFRDQSSNHLTSSF